MAAYLICLTSGGGIPLFTRSKGDLKPLPFPVIGSLNAVHMFAANHGTELKTATTEGSKIVWKSFLNSINLIIVTSEDNADDCHVNKLLDNIFHALILLYGEEELANIKNVERCKREIKVCYQLIDYILERWFLPTFSDVTNAVDTIAAQEVHILQNFLDAFTETGDSLFGCLMVHGKVAVATKKWWSLSATELILLSLLVESLLRCSSRDVPVYLPQMSPSVPHRLLTFSLMNGVDVCIICGPAPSLSQLEKEVGRFWGAAFDSLKSLREVHPRNIPPNITLDPNIMGFMLINGESNRCLCSVDVNSCTSEHSINGARRREILRCYYQKVIGTYFSSTIEGSENGPTEFAHKPFETYVVTESYKIYALQLNTYHFFVLYTIDIPTYAMRSVTQKSLNILIKDKNVLI
ncbi:protein fuzzy homolog [Patella vulgata]|uniref:protein fuzzy homolog n=1 Tax=Patella vulgata TaxID=6465 RepID=UPI00218053C6|nr:protein fuzzy homolog [Patella vulgata]